jgi:hypothetical protein
MLTAFSSQQSSFVVGSVPVTDKVGSFSSRHPCREGSAR